MIVDGPGHEQQRHADTGAAEIDCDKVVSELYRYIDHLRRIGEPITPQLAVEIKHHLGGCSPCLEAMDFEYEFLDMVKVRCTEVAAPAGLAERIRRSMAGPLDPPRLGGIPGL